MKKKIPHTFLGNVLNFHLPKSWGELNNEQLLYIAYVMCHFEPAQMKTYIFIRFAGIRVHRKNRRGWVCSIRHGWWSKVRFILADWQIESFIHQLDWLDEPSTQPICVSSVSHWVARDVQLKNLPFGHYLICENLYQGYLYDKDVQHLRDMVQYLYKDVRKWGFILNYHHWTDSELLTIFLWWMSIKLYFAKVFPHFFHPIDCTADAAVPDMMEQMNVQIRALTGGDVTKEDYVMGMDTWRALTELDAKAREVEELRKRQNH